jgi:hypothetical protein
MKKEKIDIHRYSSIFIFCYRRPLPLQPSLVLYYAFDGGPFFTVAEDRGFMTLVDVPAPELNSEN